MPEAASRPDGVAAARAYHERTKHSPDSVRRTGYRLDWDNQPLPFKIYTSDLPVTVLPQQIPPSQASLIATLLGSGADGASRASLDLALLARLLYLSAGVVRTRSYPSGHVQMFRAAACTGALYHVDVYVACADIEGLAAGVYHFGPQDFALRLLRSGDHRAVLVDATGGSSQVAEAPVVLVLASTYWRNAWKYHERAYRHSYWDSGTIVANLLAVADGDGIASRVLTGFVDSEVESLLGLDPALEAATAVVALGAGARRAEPSRVELEPLHLSTQQLSARPVQYWLLPQTHQATALASADEVSQWHGQSVLRRGPEGAGGAVALPPAATERDRRIDDTIIGRGSARRFDPEPVTEQQLTTLLACASAGMDSDFARTRADHLCDTYAIVHGAGRIAPGAYYYDSAGHCLAPLPGRVTRQGAGFLALEQELAADAAVDIYSLSDLEWVFRALGGRGYRAAALEGAVGGGRAYLAAYAMGLGATGLTFYDDYATQAFEPHAAGKAVMFLTAVGHRLRAGT